MFFQLPLPSDQLVSFMHQHGGVARTSELLTYGFHPRLIYQLRDSGLITEISRGIFALPGSLDASDVDLVAIAMRVPEGVICLISALSFYELTNEIPHEVYVAVPQRKQTPGIIHPPVRVFHYSQATISAGVDTHLLGSVTVKVFSPEKTIADCFKFRHKIGIDVAIEGLKRCLAGNGSRQEIIKYARICRVEKVMTPYLEAII